MSRRGFLSCFSGVSALATFALALFLSSSILCAEDASHTARAVRLSSVEGGVRIAQGNQLIADPALANTPLFEGTEILTADDGRAELQFDDGSIARLSPNSSLTLTVLRSGAAELTLTSGLGYFELQSPSATGSIRVHFGDSIVAASGGFSILRVSLDNLPGEVAVFSGDAHLERGSALALDLHGGESVMLDASDPSQYVLNGAIEPDSWDAWNSDRDEALTAAAAARTGAADGLPQNSNPAWNDLDANGNWYNVPDQGEVWAPYDAAAAGWDPYGNGNWMWTPGYGYIWVSGDPWGYMPFQCGAWNFYSGFGWGWAPGGCRPWWRGGGWISNIGSAPTWYRLPIRPRPSPPRGPIGRPLRGGFVPPQNAIVSVNNRPAGALASSPHNGHLPVSISGYTVMPLRPVSPRPAYGAASSNRSHPYTGARVIGEERPEPGAAVIPLNPRPAPGAVNRDSRPVPARPAGGGQFAPQPSRAPYSGPAPAHVSSGPPASVSHSGGGGHR
jgi:hypothetical protein